MRFSLTKLVVCCLFPGRVFGFVPIHTRTVLAAKSMVDTQTPQALVTGHRSMQQVDKPTTCHMMDPKVAASALLLGVLSTIKIVKQGNISIVERLGKYHK